MGTCIVVLKNKTEFNEILFDNITNCHWRLKLQGPKTADWAGIRTALLSNEKKKKK